MTFEELVAAIRTEAGDRDSAAYRYTTNEIALTLRDVRRSLGVMGVASLDDLSVDVTEEAEAITPEPTDIQGDILAKATALKILEQTFRRRVDDGSLGVTWRSGLEQESTVSQEKAYRSMLSGLRSDLDSVILIAGAGSAATRPQ